MAGGSRSTVLVVDDEPAIRLLCRVNLELDGYAVLEAGSLAEARELLAEEPDLVLLDLHLGNDVSEELIAECGALVPPIPVALVTGSTDLEAAGRAGAAAVLAKPFTLDELAGTVRSLATRDAAAG